MSVLFEMQHVNVCYEEEPVLWDITLQIQKGEILGIAGESGSGKSTWIKAAMGLLGSQGEVTRGGIFYQGQNLQELSKEELRKLHGPEMGVIFQNTGLSLCPVRTIGEQICECVQEHEKKTKEEIRKDACKLLARLHLSDGEKILESYPFELSGGMSQRVGIVMAMLLKPKLIFADEPTSALDVTVQASVVKELLSMREMYGTAFVVVTHNIGVLERMADTIAVLHEGRMVEYGKKEEVLQHPQHAYTKELLGSVLRLKR